MKILALAYFFLAASAAGVIVSEGIGRPNLPALFATISAIINLAAALILIPSQGAIGAAWALLINGALQVPVFIWVVNIKIAKISHFEYLKLVFLKPFLSLVISIIIVELCLIVFTASNFINLAVDIIIFGICYLGCNLWLKTFQKEDEAAFFFIAIKITKLI